MKRALAIALAAFATTVFGAAPIRDPGGDNTATIYDAVLTVPETNSTSVPAFVLGPFDVAAYKTLRITVTHDIVSGCSGSRAIEFCGSQYYSAGSIRLDADGAPFSVLDLYASILNGTSIQAVTRVEEVVGPSIGVRVFAGTPGTIRLVRIQIYGRSN